MRRRPILLLALAALAVLAPLAPAGAQDGVNEVEVVAIEPVTEEVVDDTDAHDRRPQSGQKARGLARIGSRPHLGLQNLSFRPPRRAPDHL